jgi:dimethyladenosine transferase 1
MNLGPGGLTRACIEAGAKEIVVVEKDLRFMEGLQLLSNKVNPDVNLRLFHSDALTFPMVTNNYIFGKIQ